VSKLSVVVITHNEARHVAACLASLAFADEVVVVDDASTDGTAELARQAGARVIVHPHEGENWDLNKNVGMDAATGDWVLLVDADERVDAALAAGIREATRDTPHAGFWMPRREIYFGFHARHAASGAKVLRLFRRGAARFEGDRLHVNPRVEGSVGELAQALDHLAYDRVRDYVEKTNRYTDHEAERRYAAGERADWRAIVLEPLKLFRFRFWVLKGYKDGMPGLVFSLVTSLYPLLQNLKLWELEARARRSE
jgi:glycosyltransferase involved in cell wall biosynthesis